MSDTSIQWTDKIWNPVTGCTKVSTGCKNCYAETVANRFWKDRKFTDVQTHDDRLKQPLHWRKPARIFVNSMSDLFHEDVPFEFIDRVFAVMALTPHHTYQILTKRPARMLQYKTAVETFGALRIERGGKIGLLTDQPDWIDLPRGRSFTRFPKSWPLPNVHLGVSVEDQNTADHRIPILLQTPAAVRFISYEPAIGPVNLREFLWVGEEGGIDYSYTPRQMLDWVIVGGESGPGARAFNIQWARDVIGQCKTAGVACFVKQLGAVPYEYKGNGFFSATPGHTPFEYPKFKDRKGGDINEWPSELRVREFPV